MPWAPGSTPPRRPLLVPRYRTGTPSDPRSSGSGRRAGSAGRLRCPPAGVRGCVGARAWPGPADQQYPQCGENREREPAVGLLHDVPGRVLPAVPGHPRVPRPGQPGRQHEPGPGGGRHPEPGPTVAEQGADGDHAPVQVVEPGDRRQEHGQHPHHGHHGYGLAEPLQLGREPEPEHGHDCRARDPGHRQRRPLARSDPQQHAAQRLVRRILVRPEPSGSRTARPSSTRHSRRVRTGLSPRSPSPPPRRRQRGRATSGDRPVHPEDRRGELDRRGQPDQRAAWPPPDPPARDVDQAQRDQRGVHLTEADAVLHRLELHQRTGDDTVHQAPRVRRSARGRAGTPPP